jgi:hypothetical protein
LKRTLKKKWVVIFSVWKAQDKRREKTIFVTQNNYSENENDTQTK